MRRFYLFIFVIIGLFQCVSALAAPRFEYTPEAQQAYEKVMSLRFDETRIILDWIKINDPENLIVYHVENYIDFFTVFINEESAEFEILEKNKSSRLKKIQQGPKDSPYYLYAQAEIRLQWALARLKFEEYVTAFNEISKAYKQLKENQKKFPSFIANKKSLGILHALLGTIPDNYKFGVKILGGMAGTIEQGRLEIEEVLNYAKTHDFLFEEETIVMYSWLLLHLKNQTDEAWAVVSTANLKPKNNPLACFIMANVAMRTGRNDEAIHLLEHRPKDAVYHPFHYLDFMLGITKLYRQDIDANFYLERYTTIYQGQNYIKEAYQKLAWYHLLRDNETMYHQYMQECKTKGLAIIDGDKTALREARQGETPNPTLLKARLLFDGGYAQKAYTQLIQYNENDFNSNKHQLEYRYRLGRITHQLKQYEFALKYYQQTVDLGQNEPYFFACNAALQMGLIYEKQQAYPLAIEAFNRCLSLKPDEYKNSLHQKAKAGKNRVAAFIK